MATYVNAIKILRALFFRKEPVVSFTPTYEHKAAPKPATVNEVKIERSSPESVGIRSEHILNFYSALEKEISLNMHTVTVARNGKIISEGEFFPYKVNIPSVSHSLSKSVVSLCIGLLCDDKILSVDEKVVDIFADELNFAARTMYQKLTVRHLLIMSSGSTFNEVGSVTDNDWIKSFFESVPMFKPGSRFNYNSMNTYVLSAIIKKKTGKPMSDLLSERIFLPMGITAFCWEKCPKGIEKGGWGLYMYPEDVIKLGQLVADKGIYNGKRIISEKWIKEATSVKIKTPQLTGDYDYGYHMWINPEHDEVLFNGMFGQNLHIFKRTHIVIMTTAGNNDIFQRCKSYKIIQKYFGKTYTPNSILEECPDKFKVLREKEKKLCKSASLEESILKNQIKDPSEFILRTQNRKFVTNKKECVGISIYPVLAQTVHNNFRQGLDALSFSSNVEGYFVTFFENNKKIKLKVGFDKAEFQNVKIGKEPHMLAVYATAAQDEDDNDVLKLTIVYPELPNVRYFKIYFYKNSLKIKCSETPGYDFAIKSLKMILDNSLDEKLVQTVSNYTQKGVNKYLENFLSPTVTATEIL